VHSPVQNVERGSHTTHNTGAPDPTQRVESCTSNEPAPGAGLRGQSGGPWDRRLGGGARQGASQASAADRSRGHRGTPRRRPDAARPPRQAELSDARAAAAGARAQQDALADRLREAAAETDALRAAARDAEAALAAERAAAPDAAAAAAAGAAAEAELGAARAAAAAELRAAGCGPPGLLGPAGAFLPRT